MYLPDERAAIERALRVSPLPLEPGALIAGVKALGFRDTDVRAALWTMIDHGQVTITDEFHMALTGAAGAVETGR